MNGVDVRREATATIAWPSAYLLVLLSFGSVSAADVADLKVRAAIYAWKQKDYFED
jgi:hypothetical protein